MSASKLLDTEEFLNVNEILATDGGPITPRMEEGTPSLNIEALKLVDQSHTTPSKVTTISKEDKKIADIIPIRCESRRRSTTLGTV